MLDKTPEAYQPVLLDSSTGRTIAEDWARGFFAAVTLRGASWAALLVPEHFGLIAPIAVHWSNQEGLPLVPGSAERIAEIQERAVGLLPAAVIAIDQFWKGRRQWCSAGDAPGGLRIDGKGWPQRSLSMRFRKEVQAVLWHLNIASTPVGSVRFHANPPDVFSCRPTPPRPRYRQRRSRHPNPCPAQQPSLCRAVREMVPGLPRTTPGHG